MTENRSLMRRLFEPKSLDHQAPAAKFVTYALLFIWSLVVLIPLYWVLITAFKNQGDVANGPFYLPFIDFQPKTDAWHFMLVENNTIGPYINSVVVSLGRDRKSVV